MLQAEIGLMALVVGLYLYDAALLLYCNEGVLRPRGRDAWAVGFGSARFQLRGKELYLPNPFLMHKPLFRLAWTMEGLDQEESQGKGKGGGKAADKGAGRQGAGRQDAAARRWTAARGSYRGAAPMLWGIALGLFVLLPLGLFSRLGEPMLLLALALTYLNLFALLAWLWFSRKRLGLAPRRVASMAFETLSCPPFALNLVRHLSLARAVDEDLAGAARRLQRPADWELTRHALLARLQEEIESEVEASPRQLRLQAHHHALAQESP
jgi:hypothetical protein